MQKTLLPNFIARTAATVILLLALTSAGRVQAQTFYTAASFSYNNFPFNGSSSGGNMCQFLYFPGDFNTTPSGGTLITTIYFKAATSGSCNYTNLSIKMANTTMGSLTSGTWNSGLTTVLSSTSYSSSWSSGSWYAFTLPTPFFYSGGNLLVEVSQSGLSSTGMGVWYYSGSVNKRMYGIVSSTTSTGADVNPLSFGFDQIPAACSGTPAAGTITNAAANPAAPLCAGGTTTITGTDPNLGNGLTYSWQSGPSSTGLFTNVTGGSGAATLSYTTGAVASTTWFRLGITCTNSSITTYSAPYQVLVGAPQPSAITGSPTSCPGDASTYSVTNVASTTYTWTLPSGWTGTSTTNSILATPGSTGGTISVTATSPCGTSVPRTYTVVPGSAPAAPIAISGNTSVCASSLQTYSVPVVAGTTSYQWTLPSGWTGTSTTNTITVTTSSSAATGIISVKAVNGCGNSSNTNLSVNVINSLTGPGVITPSPAPQGGVYCTGALYSFSIAPVPGATSYIWSLPSGWTGTVTGTTIQAFPSSSSGSVQVTAYAACATSSTSSLTTTVVGTVSPSVSITSNSTALCQGIPSTFTATPVNGGTAPTYIWKKNGATVAGTNNSYTDASLVNGDLLSVVMISNATCRATDTIASNSLAASITASVTPGIGINSTPVVTICQGTVLNFSTTTTGGGTAPTYQWYQNNLAITGATTNALSTAAITNGDTITVLMTTNAACPKFPVASSNKVGIIVNNLVSPTVTAAASSTQPLPGQPITFTATQSGGGSTPVYQWMLNGVAIPGETGTSYTTSSLKDGDRVSVQMISYDPCARPGVVLSNEVIMGNPTGVGSITSNWNGSVSLYPNPTGGHFIIAASWNAANADGRVSVDVLNVLGQRIYHSEIAPDKAQSQSQWHYDVQLGDNIAAGQYVVRLSTASGMSATLPLTLSR